MTDNKEPIGHCEACIAEIFEGEKHHSGFDCIMCEACAPTYADMLERPAQFVSFVTDDPMTPDEVKELVQAHLLAGGSVNDKLVR